MKNIFVLAFILGVTTGYTVQAQAKTDTEINTQGLVLTKDGLQNLNQEMEKYIPDFSLDNLLSAYKYVLIHRVPYEKVSDDENYDFYYLEFGDEKPIVKYYKKVKLVVTVTMPGIRTICFFDNKIGVSNTRITNLKEPVFIATAAFNGTSEWGVASIYLTSDLKKLRY